MAHKSSAYMVRFPFKIALKVVAGIPAFAATAICLYPFSFMFLLFRKRAFNHSFVQKF